MNTIALIVGCLLLGQQSESTKPHRLHPPEMVASAMTLPAGGQVTGQPLTLLSALSSTTDRRVQLETARAYWQLSQSVAEYGYCLSYVSDLEQYSSIKNQSASVRLARASAAAMLRQVELKAVHCQCELARLVRLPTEASLPLPADRPHVGPYRTNFEQLFAGKTPPEPVAMIERILPIRRQAVDEQAAAVQAAEDALQAVADKRDTDPAAWIACRQNLFERQTAFIGTVCQYNREIADYGLIVAAPGANPQTLVAMLIGVSPHSTEPAISGDSTGGAVQPAGATAPVGNELRQTSQNEPTLAPPRDQWRTTESVRTATPGGLQPVGKNEPTLAPPRENRQGDEKNEPTLAPPRASLERPTDDFDPQPLRPIEPPPSTSAEERTVRKPTFADVSPLYPALIEMAPAVKAKQLAVALHWDRSLPEMSGTPLSLGQCLVQYPGADRRGVIAAYWKLRDRQAKYQVLLQQVELLESLMPAVLKRVEDPQAAVEMLQVRAAQLSAQAAATEARAELVAAQYDLALRIGVAGESAWPLASTVPHAGSYLLKLDAQPPGLVASWPIRRLTVAIPTMAETVRQLAVAVVVADQLRVEAVEHYVTGQTDIDPAIKAIVAQTRQTVALLDAMTDYNLAIAEYALAVLPASMPADKLAAALVITP